MTFRDACRAEIRAFLARVAASVAIILLGRAAAALLSQPLTRPQQTMLVLLVGVFAIIAAVGVATRDKRLSLRAEPWLRGVAVVAGSFIAGIGTVVLLQGTARAVPISVVLPRCPVEAGRCEVAVSGTLTARALAPKEGVLVLFRALPTANWTVAGVAEPAPGSMVWSSTFTIKPSVLAGDYEILGIVGRASTTPGEVLRLDGFAFPLNAKRLALPPAPASQEVKASRSRCCGGTSCSASTTWCASGWTEVPCEEELHASSRQWRLRLGPMREKANSDQALRLAEDEMEVCIRAGGQLQCETLPLSGRSYPNLLSTASLEGAFFTVSVRERATPQAEWRLIARGQHHRVKIVPQAICNGFLIPLDGESFESLSIYLDAP